MRQGVVGVLRMRGKTLIMWFVSKQVFVVHWLRPRPPFIHPKTVKTGKTRHYKLTLKYIPKKWVINVIFPNKDLVIKQGVVGVSLDHVICVHRSIQTTVLLAWQLFSSMGLFVTMWHVWNMQNPSLLVRTCVTTPQSSMILDISIVIRSPLHKICEV